MLNDKEHAEKHLLALHRELKTLHHRRQHPPVHELIPPIQRGWKRLFVLSKAALVRPDVAVLSAILDCLNNVRYFWRPDFRYTRRQRGERRTVTIEQELMSIRADCWDKGPVPENWRKYFRCELVSDRFVRSRWRDKNRETHEYPRCTGRHRSYVWAYVFRYRTLFELRIKKHWLTHYYEVEPEVIERIAEIDNRLTQHRGNEIFCRLKGISVSRWRCPDKRQRCLREQARREMHASLGSIAKAAVESISSSSSCGGTVGGMDSAAAGGGYLDFPIFCGSEIGATSSSKRPHRRTAGNRRPCSSINFLRNLISFNFEAVRMELLRS